MEPTQQTTATVADTAPVNPGIFGTGIPSLFAFGLGVLLFFLPFIELKCGNTTLQQVSGFQLASGFSVKTNNTGNSFMDDFNTNKSARQSTKGEKKDPNMFAMIAMGLGVIGLLLSFAKARIAIGGAVLTGLLSAVALIGLMIDIKKKVKLEMPEGRAKDDNNFFKGMNNITDNMGVSVDFTPWFYLAVIAFLAAAFFCYKRMSSTVKSQLPSS